MLSEKGIKFIQAPNQKAIELYNELISKKRVLMSRLLTKEK